MNKKISLGAALALLLVVAAATISMTMVYARKDYNARINALKEREQNFEKFAEIDRQVRLNYYADINQTQLMDSIANGYLQGLGDQYATYRSVEETKKKLDDTKKELVGIGALVEVADDDFYLEIKEVYPESPAQLAGIIEGDLIVKVDDTDLTRENSSQQLATLVGPQGTTINLVVRRGSEENSITLTRRPVAVPTVYSEVLSPSADDSPVGYMRITDFTDRTDAQFNRDLQKLTEAGVSGLVFDLRDNTGTNLKNAARILDKLLPQGVLVNATNKKGTTEVLYTSDANEVRLPMAVIINGKTENAAELFAQSIKEYEKGPIVGETSAGRASILDVLHLNDGSEIELTVAIQHPKSGMNFNGVGIKPDYEVKLDEDWAKMERENDPQVLKAVEAVLSILKATAASGDSNESSQSEQSTSTVESSSSSETEPSDQSDRSSSQ